MMVQLKDIGDEIQKNIIEKFQFHDGTIKSVPGRK